MPHILVWFHKPFWRQDTAPAFSSLHWIVIYFSLSNLKIYTTHCIYRLHPSADSAFKFSLKRSMLCKVETGLALMAADEHSNAFDLFPVVVTMKPQQAELGKHEWHTIRSFPGFKGCIAVKLCHFRNLSECYTSCNICLQPL